MKKFILILTILMLFLTSCTEVNNENDKLVEDKKIYDKYNSDDIKEIYITVLPPEGDPEYNYTLSQLNTDDGYIDDKEVKVKVIFQEGKNGQPLPEYFGYGLTSTNGEMKLRGQSSRLGELKSYKIKLLKGAGEWNGFRTINLSKHPFDKLRIRNKLAFELFEDIPNFSSLRIDLVHLFIKDLSEGNFTEEFVDYGLYSSIENMDINYLESHGLDKKGSLYKAEFFEFFRYEDNIKLKDDPDYDKDKFEEILEIKGNDDHQKIINMLNAVNNEFIHINDVIDKYFDRENYLTWLAINIITFNTDSNSKNFYLYSPTDSDKFYFLPWDYDGSFRLDINRAEWQRGISNYLGVILHNRFLKNDNNLNDLTKKIEELQEYFKEDKINTLLKKYQPILEDFLLREPDKSFLDKKYEHNYTLKDMLIEIDSVKNTVKESTDNYYESLQKPFPVFMGEPINLGEYYIFPWTDSYDLQGDLLEYSIEISTTPDFENPIYYKDGIIDLEHVVYDIKPGEYYWRVRVKDSSGNEQQAYDVYYVSQTDFYHGVKKFIAQNTKVRD